MSVGSSLSGISFSGLGSGIDTTSIVQKLMAIEQQPIQLIQRQQQAVAGKQTIFAAFRTQLQSITSASAALNLASTFNTVAASSSDATVATITNDTTSTAGVYTLAVSKLAQANKISSTAQADTTTALNLPASSFVINGKQVNLDGSESLRGIAQKINAAGANVTASLIDGGAGSAYLTLTSTQTGAGSKLSLSNLSGTTLSTLGLTSGASTVRETIAGGATSVAFSSQTDTLQTLIPGLPQNMDITVNGTTVSIDTSVDSLQSLSNKLSAITNVTSAARAVTVNGASVYKLDIKGTDGNAPTITANALTDALGITQAGAPHELLAAQDAVYTLDNIHLTSASNTITTAIPGATIKLLKADVTTPPTTQISLTQDSSGTISKIQSMVDAYNTTVDFISTQSAFDSKTFQTGILFGDPVAQQVQTNLQSMVTSKVPGLSTKYQSLQALGFKLDDTGHLSFDNATVSAALSTNSADVAALFQASGSSQNTALSYVSSTSKTKTAGTGSYAVQISQAATQGSNTGEMAQTATSTIDENLTFNGALFGTTPYVFKVSTGSTAADTVRSINSDAKLKDLVSASLDGTGKLMLTSKKFGNNGNFSVGSSQQAAANNSGIGYGSGGVAVHGVDVAGTINGEPATGSGQYLSGNNGNRNTEGLQIQYTGTATGSVGDMKFVKGIGSGMSDLMLSLTDPTNGLLTNTDNTLTSQMTDMTNEITDLQSRLALKQTELTNKYNAMEMAISSLKQQAAQLTAVTGG